jgi:hypothetical protein
VEREKNRRRGGGRGIAGDNWAGDHKIGDHLAGFDDDRRGRGRGCGTRGWALRTFFPSDSSSRRWCRTYV